MIESPLIDSFSLGLSGRISQDLAYAGVRSDGAHVIAVADGVGGSSDGRRASELAISELHHWVTYGEGSLGAPFESADRKLKEAVSNESETQSLATTLTVVLIEGRRATYAHVGDCRLYLLRGQGLRTITTDQTEVAKLVALGVVSKERAKRYRRSNVLISALGGSLPYELEAGEFSLEDGDRLMLCSDGLYKALSKRQLAALSANAATSGDLIVAIQHALESSPPSDDATAAVFDVRLS